MKTGIKAVLALERGETANPRFFFPFRPGEKSVFVGCGQPLHLAHFSPTPHWHWFAATLPLPNNRTKRLATVAVPQCQRAECAAASGSDWHCGLAGRITATHCQLPVEADSSRTATGTYGGTMAQWHEWAVNGPLATERQRWRRALPQAPRAGAAPRSPSSPPGRARPGGPPLSDSPSRRRSGVKKKAASCYLLPQPGLLLFSTW